MSAGTKAELEKEKAYRLSKQYHCPHKRPDGEPQTFVHKMVEGDGTYEICVMCQRTWDDGSGPKMTMSATKLGAVVTFDKTKRTPPPHYLRRNVNQKNHHGYSNWSQCEWGKLEPKSFAEAETFINKWNAAAPTNAEKGWEYKLPLHCDRCYHVCNETHHSMAYVGKHVCMDCWKEGNQIEQGWKAEQEKAKMKMQQAKVRSVGEMWKLPAANAPMGAEQWGYQGTSKNPYVITAYKTKRDGSTTLDGWACSCMSFTRNVPRTPCKHILNVMLNEGKTPTNTKANAKTVAAVAGLSETDLDSFKKWQMEEAAKKEVKPTSGKELNLFGATGRKFR